MSSHRFSTFINRCYLYIIKIQHVSMSDGKHLKWMGHRCRSTVILTHGTLRPLVWLVLWQLRWVDKFMVNVRWFWSACCSSVSKWTPALHVLLHVWQNGTSARNIIISTLNAWSVVHKTAKIHLTIEDKWLDVLAISNTWISLDAPDAISNDMAPPGLCVNNASHPDEQWEWRLDDILLLFALDWKGRANKGASGRHRQRDSKRSAWIERCQLECRYSKKQSSANPSDYRQTCCSTSKLIRICTGSFICNEVSKASDNPQLLWSFVQNLLHPGAGGAWYDGFDTFTMAVGIQAFFVDKVNQVKTKVAAGLWFATDCQFINPECSYRHSSWYPSC